MVVPAATVDPAPQRRAGKSPAAPPDPGPGPLVPDVDADAAAAAAASMPHPRSRTGQGNSNLNSRPRVGTGTSAPSDAGPATVARDILAAVPREVLVQIFRTLPTKTLMTVIPAVCKRWKRTLACALHLDVDFRWCRKRLTDAALLSTAGRFGGIRTLSLAGCRHVTDSGLLHLAPLCASLATLDLSSSAISSDCIKVFTAMCPTLRSINLNRCGGFCDEGMASIAANCSQLHTLDAVGCDGLSNDAASYQRLARGCQRLKTIDLSECDDVRDECVIVVAKSCPELRFINLSGCKKVSDAGLESLATHCLHKKLQSLNVSECTQLSLAGFETFSVGVPQLTSLYLGGLDAVGPDFVARLPVFWSMLTLLDISDCGNVTDGALATIAAGLKQLRRLYLGSCRKVTAAGIEQLSKGCPSLICLDFEGCAETTDQWLTHVTVGWPAVRLLNLSDCQGITDDGLVALVDTCTKIGSINLAWCKQISAAGLCAVAERCKGLREVDITGCEVTPSWFEALTACQSLKCLWVGEEFRHHSGVHTLMRALPRVHIRFAY